MIVKVNLFLDYGTQPLSQRIYVRLCYHNFRAPLRVLVKGFNLSCPKKEGILFAIDPDYGSLS